MGRFVKDHGAFFVPHFFQVLPTVFVIGGQKALEGEASGIHAGHRQGGDHGAAAGDAHHLNAPGGAQSYQIGAGVGDGRRAGIGDDGAILACFDAVGNVIALGLAVMFKIADLGLADAEMAQQPGTHAGVFGGDEIHAVQGLHRAGRKIAQIADGGGYHIQFSCHTCSVPPRGGCRYIRS